MTERTRIRRLPEKAATDRAVLSGAADPDDPVPGYLSTWIL